MLNFKSTNETIEGYAIILEEFTYPNGFKVEESMFDIYRELKHCKSALKSNKGLRHYNNGKMEIRPHRIDRVRVVIEKID